MSENEAVKPAQTALQDTRWASRYAKVDLSRITVRKAISDEDFALVARLRAMAPWLRPSIGCCKGRLFPSRPRRGG